MSDPAGGYLLGGVIVFTFLGPIVLFIALILMQIVKNKPI